MKIVLITVLLVLALATGVTAQSCEELQQAQTDNQQDALNSMTGVAVGVVIFLVIAASVWLSFRKRGG